MWFLEPCSCFVRLCLINDFCSAKICHQKFTYKLLKCIDRVVCIGVDWVCFGQSVCLNECGLSIHHDQAQGNSESL
jgi:hypothetical protein